MKEKIEEKLEPTKDQIKRLKQLVKCLTKEKVPIVNPKVEASKVTYDNGVTMKFVFYTIDTEWSTFGGGDINRVMDLGFKINTIFFTERRIVFYHEEDDKEG